MRNKSAKFNPPILRKVQYHVFISIPVLNHRWKSLSNLAGIDLLLVAGVAELGIPAADSAVLSVGGAGGADLERVVGKGLAIGAVGVGAPALAVEVANRRILS